MSIEQLRIEGRLIRNEWAREDNGRQLLCLYTALAGDPAARPETCPAELAPLWWAKLLPWIDDAGSAAKWPEVVRRVAALQDRFASWGRRELLLVLLAILDGLPGEYSRAIRALLGRELAGEAVSSEEYASASASASASSASSASYAYASYAASAASDYAYASYAASAYAAASAAYAAASAASADAVIDRILTALEQQP